MFRTVATLLMFVAVATAAKDKATGLSFPDKLGGNKLWGTGVRTKGPIKVYAVGAYGPDANIKKRLADLSAKSDKKKALSELSKAATDSSSMTFLLKFTFPVSAEKVAASISDSVATRYPSGSAEIAQFKNVLCDGVGEKGAKKGTTIQFDCSKRGGIKVALDGKSLGAVGGKGLSQALCKVYTDEKAVSPALRLSCLANFCGL